MKKLKKTTLENIKFGAISGAVLGFVFVGGPAIGTALNSIENGVAVDIAVYNAVVGVVTGVVITGVGGAALYNDIWHHHNQ